MKQVYIAAVFVFFYSFAASFQTSAQEAGQTSNSQVNEQVLREILAEIKQLRTTLARTGVNQIRFQTTFEQYKAQQSRVDMMNRELDSLKTQVANDRFRANTEDFVKQNEERLAQTTDPRQRQNLERQIQASKRNLEVQEERLKRLKDRQTDLEMKVPMEQAKLDQLNMELERIKQDINALLSN